jgi:GNAT superfamily N-acetyltransferase
MSARTPLPVEPGDPRVETVLQTDPIGNLVIRGDLANSRPGDVRLFLDDADEPIGLLASSWWVRITAKNADALERLRPAIPERHPFEEDGELMFGGVAHWIREILVESYEVTWENPCWLYALPEEVTFPDDLPHDVRPLRPQDVPLVNEHWPHGDSVEYVGWRVEHGQTAAIFDEDRLVSWTLTHGDDEMGMLTTLPEARRRGYARSVTIGLIREIRAGGKIPFLYTLQDNAPSQRLAESVGFVRHGAYHWFGARRRA